MTRPRDSRLPGAAVSAPLPLAGMIRAELERFVEGIGARRNLQARVYVGEPGTTRVRVASGGEVQPRDAGWRADLAERAVAGADHPRCGWITRSGDLRPTDHDLAWWSACRWAFDRHGIPLVGFFVLNRHGWLELTSGQRVDFHRIRQR